MRAALQRRGHFRVRQTYLDIYLISTLYLLARYRASCVRQLTYTYTCPATVLHALHVSGLAQCTGKTSLVRQEVVTHVYDDGCRQVIHVVGARTAEVEQAACWSLVPARLPHLTRSL